MGHRERRRTVQFRTVFQAGISDAPLVGVRYTTMKSKMLVVLALLFAMLTFQACLIPVGQYGHGWRDGYHWHYDHDRR
jgi:hypothetical protein